MAKTVWLKNNGIKHVLQHNLYPGAPITSIDGFDVVELPEDVANAFLKHAPDQFVVLKKEEAAAALAAKPVLETEADASAGQATGESLDEFAARSKAERAKVAE